MTERDIELHRLESYGDDAQRVIVSFDTVRFGYFQIECSSMGTVELTNEPPLHSFTPADREYIERVAHIVWNITYRGKGKDVKTLS